MLRSLNEKREVLFVWQKIALARPANQNLVAIRVAQQKIVASSAGLSLSNGLFE